MAYTDVAVLRGDADFNRRVQACFAIETLNDPSAPPPSTWVADHMWQVAAQPGFGDAYAYALAQDPPNESPGKDPGVITDAMILAAVQALRSPEGAQ